MIRYSSLRLPFDHSEKDLLQAICERLMIEGSDLISWRILKRSLDARKGRGLSRVYSILVEVKNEKKLTSVVKRASDLAYYTSDEYLVSAIEGLSARTRPVVIGSGPAGIFAGLILAEAGLRPIIVERGKPAAKRTQDVNTFWENGVLDTESNVQFGEGGAGTFSDGKLRTRVKDRFGRSQKILREFVMAGAPEEIQYEQKPHVGTANLVRVVKNLRNKIESLGGEYLFGSKVSDLIVRDGWIKGVRLETGREVETDVVVLAIGHSARDTFEMLHHRGIQMAPKPFSVGFRIEHPQSLIDQNQYGKHAGHPALGAAEYQLSYKTQSGRAVYSFCMCPGGSVIASSSEHSTVVTNGMSQYARNLANANSAIVAEVFPADYGTGPLDGIKYQRKWEKKAFELGGRNYHAPVQLVGDFLSGKPSDRILSVKPSYTPGFMPGNLEEALPEQITRAIKEALPIFDKKIPGFSAGESVLTGVETRTSSPLRVLRGADFQSVSFRGLYPVGEGSGYAGGIMSSAIDGIKAAEKIIEAINQI